MSIFVAIFTGVLLLATGGVVSWVLVRVFRSRALLRRCLDIQMFRVVLPKDMRLEEREEGIGEDIKERISVAEQFLSTLSNLPTSWRDKLVYGPPVIVLEIVAHPDGVIMFYIGSERRYVDHLEKQIYAHYPEAEVSEAQDYTIFESGDAIKTGILKLMRKQYLPIATYRELEVDPMQSITGALSKIRGGDAAVIQYVLRPASGATRYKAARAAKRTIQGRQDDVGEYLNSFARANESLRDTMKHGKRDERYAPPPQLTQRMQQRIDLVEQKMAQQQFEVNIRVGVSVRQPEDAKRVFESIATSFSQYEMPDLNTLRVKSPHNDRGFLQNLIFRIPRKSGANILSTTELASLFHFPLPTTATPNILWRGAKKAPAPTTLVEQGVELGVNEYRGMHTPIHFSDDDRRRHMYMIGQTGTGKTTMFLHMILQDIREGKGVGVVDPHGDLVEDILMHIPPERHKDVVLFDPRDKERPLGFNILNVSNDEQKDLVVNEVVQILQKLAARLNPDSVGPMFEHYLRNALLALVEDPNATLLDVPRMFVDERFRSSVLKNNSNPIVLQFWEQEFAQSQRGQMSADMLSYVISKLGRFIGNETVRNIIGQPQSSFDVRDVMDNQKILLCNLSKGYLGDLNSELLGFVLVSKIQIAALGRANMPEQERKDFYLYIDEFQNFTTDSISTILSEARKYRLNLHLTHQFINQLEDSIRESVFGNVGTMVSYRVGVEDAEFLEKHFDPVFSAYDLINLERFTAVVRLLVHSTPQRPCSLTVPPPPSGGNIEWREAVRESSRRLYGQDKGEVERDILQRFAYNTQKDDNAPGEDAYMSESLFDIS